MARGKKKESLSIEEKLETALVPVDEQPYEIPRNWCWVYLNALISEIKNGTTVKQDKSGEGYKVTRIESLQNQTIDFERLGTIVDEASIKDSDWYREGDITLSHINSAEHVGKTALIEKDMLPLVHGMNLLRIRFYASLNPKLFQYYTQSFQYKEAILKRINMAVNQVSINQRQIGTIEIPLPPITEQYRIVECVESLFSKLDEARDKAQEALDSFENRKASILYSAFTGELSKEWRNSEKKEYQESLSSKYEDSLINEDAPCVLPDTWCWVKMGALGYTNIGLTYSPADKSEEGIIVLRSSNIQDGQMDYEDIVKVCVDIPENKMCKKGDLLICARNGSKSLVGKTAIIDRDGMSFGAFMAIFRSEYNQFIYYFLSSPFFRNLIDNDVSTTTINQVTQGIIKNLMFPLPPKHEQDYIVSKLDDILNKERETRDIAQQTIVNIDAVKKAILAKAFRGELSTNDPEDEKSIELIKRTLKEQES